ncbi:MAG: DUF357 domain-containing protein [Candidatus Micrarchaeia archaeon]
MSNVASVEERILKDIALFAESRKKVENYFKNQDPKIKKIIELSEMYASDAKSYFEKGDNCTSFSCISYAHGLLDAIKELEGISDV